MDNGLNVCDSQVFGHSHSPNDASSGEDYPEHLKKIIAEYKTFVASRQEETPNISAVNHTQQQQILGPTAPIGSDLNADERSSTRARNKANGHRLVDRNKNAPAYSASAHSTSSEDLLTTPPTKKARRGSTAQSSMESFGESRQVMAKALDGFTKCLGSNDGKTQELVFKKEMWAEQQALSKTKLVEKYKFKNEKFEFEKNQATIMLLKNDKDEAEKKCREETCADMRELYRSEYVALSKLYIEKLKEIAK